MILSYPYTDWVITGNLLESKIVCIADYEIHGKPNFIIMSADCGECRIINWRIGASDKTENGNNPYSDDLLKMVVSRLWAVENYLILNLNNIVSVFYGISENKIRSEILNQAIIEEYTGYIRNSIIQMQKFHFRNREEFLWTNNENICKLCNYVALCFKSKKQNRISSVVD